MMTCTHCGCDDNHACRPDGCHWHRPSYCSACADKHLDQLIDFAMTFIAVSDTGTLAGRPCRIVDDSGSLDVVDHIGIVAFSMGDDGKVYLAPQYGALEILDALKSVKAVAA